MADHETIYATPLLRILSTVIDALLANAISYGFSIVSAILHNPSIALLGTFASLFFSFYNFIYLPGKEGSSIGQRVVHIKIVDEVTGNPLGYLKVFIRLLIAVVSTLALFIGYFWILWDKKKQSWHDKAVKSVVVKA